MLEERGGRGRDDISAESWRATEITVVRLLAIQSYGHQIIVSYIASCAAATVLFSCIICRFVNLRTKYSGSW